MKNHVPEIIDSVENEASEQPLVAPMSPRGSAARPTDFYTSDDEQQHTHLHHHHQHHPFASMPGSGVICNPIPGSEDISREQLEHYAETLATAHRVATLVKSQPLLIRRLDENVKILKHAYEMIYEALMTGRRVTPTDEWLMDNFYLVEEQIRLAKKHLPAKYSREMPQLLNGPIAGFPRIYGVMMELTNLVNGRIDEETVSVFVDSYQNMSALTLGELWGVPIMLRLGLLERIRLVADEIIRRRVDCNLADSWADKLLNAAEKSSRRVVAVLSDMSSSIKEISNDFVIQMLQRLQGSDPLLSVITTWLQQQISTQGLDVDDIYRVQRHSLHEEQVSMSNSIQSLRFVNEHEWNKFVEAHSKVEKTLREDPSRAYAQQDFATRDRCRHVVEKLAKWNERTELEIAELVVEESYLAKTYFDQTYPTMENMRSKSMKSPEELSKDLARSLALKKCHVAYWLLDDQGKFEFQEKHELKVDFMTRIQRHLGTAYFASIALFTLMFSIAILTLLVILSNGKLWFGSMNFWILLPLLTVVGSQLAITITNRISTFLARPNLTPRMDFETGVPDEHRTMVVIPTMLTSLDGAKELLQDLLTRHLVNKDRNILFALLTDFADSPTEVKSNDQMLLDAAVKGINELNALYPPEEGSPSSTIFYLLHRKREYNAQENVWMGWERKRGKLTNFNSLIKGDKDVEHCYSKMVGDMSVLPSIRYIITLDTDTMLPPDSARKLIGNAAHILNHAVVDMDKGRVISGYGVLQPRVSVALTGAFRSVYARINSLDGGIDPYTREVSDVYQDVFGEGSFIGKGLYTVDQFEQVLSGTKLPENRILSHDLLEGCYTRSGLVSDVELFEEYPSSYIVDASRKHRWVRGDWQIASWIMSSVPTSDGVKKNPFTLLSRWKIFDNLRRSLVPLCMTLVLLMGWVNPHLGSQAPSVLTSAVLSVYLFPNLLNTLDELFSKQSGITFDTHLRVVSESFLYRVMDMTTQILFMPFEAYNNADAMLRSLYRLIISRKHLLQWTTSTSAAAAYSKSDPAEQLRLMFRQMWIAPAVAIFTLCTVIIRALAEERDTSLTDELLTCWFIIGGWVVSPVIAWWMSKPIHPESLSRTEEPLTQSDYQFLKSLSRHTWRYFEVFAARSEDHYLPLDNFQEFPKPMLARRTSPTNIGFSLVANLSAYDFGYITAGLCIDRCAKTLETLSKMERHRGHFYNWYDTSTLNVLTPRYVSSVDSGNLVALLLILRSGLLELLDKPILPKKTLEGLRDTVLCLKESIERTEKAQQDSDDFSGEIMDDLRAVASMVANIEQQLDEEPEFTGLMPWLEMLITIAHQLAAKISDIVNNLISKGDEPPIMLDEDIAPEGELRQEKHVLFWANAFERQLFHLRNELTELAPWQGLLPVPVSVQRILDQLAVSDDEQLKNAVSEFQEHILPKLQTSITLKEILSLNRQSDDILTRIRDHTGSNEESAQWIDGLKEAIERSAHVTESRMKRIDTQIDLIADFIKQDFTFLYNPARKLLSIGYNVDHNRMDSSFYDMLCSEARLTSYAAIATNQLPVSHWFAMGRLLTSYKRRATLLSWSGSMFEYLMPLLVMPTLPGTLLDETYHSVVMRHIEYGQQKKCPWGISESAYNMMDSNLIYQYGPFGVPGLGLKRGLSDDLVIAPYASCLALMIKPKASCDNLRRLVDFGAWGEYGMIESIDFTPHRLRGDIRAQPIRSFFAHHSGMSLLSLATVLLDKPMHRRFAKDPLLHANELLLQEKVPRMVYISNPNENETNRWKIARHQPPAATRIYQGVQNSAPEVHLLSNGQLHVMLSVNGGGYINSRNLAVTRWREDVTLDGYGVSCYLRDIDSKKLWSTTSTPILAQSNLNYSVIFSQARAEFRRRQHGISARTIVSVSPYDDVEVRRITLTNKSVSKVRKIEVTTYGEIVLNTARSDASHRAFSNLFIRTEILPDYSAILCTRRPRTHEEKKLFAFHILFLHDPRVAVGEQSFETDRYRFIGRGKSMQLPKCMQHELLSNTDGFPLDPIVAVRQVVAIKPGATVSLDIVTGVANTREETMQIIRKYQHRKCTDRVLNFSWISSQRLSFQLGITEIEAQLFGRLASSILYCNPRYRASLGIIAKSRRNQTYLWRFGISGEIPIILVRINDVRNMTLMRQCLQAHTYLRFKGVACDLVVWNNETSSYREDMHANLLALLASRQETTDILNRPGGVHMIRGDQLSEDEGVLLYATARIVLSDNGGSLPEQLERHYHKDTAVPEFQAELSIKRPPVLTSTTAISSTPSPDVSGSVGSLIMYNGIGGFTQDGTEYVITVDPSNDVQTPNPWCNVIANERFGSVVSERGSMYTWYDNAHEFRLSPWNNDPLPDGSGEAFYIRDEESGKFWSPMPQPAPGPGPYKIRHGMGYSVWEYTSPDQIHSEVTTFVPLHESIKVVLVRVQNTGARERKLSVTGFVEWTLGELRDLTYPHIVTDVETSANSSAIIARNSYNVEYSNHVAFFMVVGQRSTLTADRSEFIGYNRTLAKPLAMTKAHLSGTVGAALDPCAAIQMPFTVEAGKSIEVAFVLGAQNARDQAMDLVQRIRSNLIIRQLLRNVKNYWQHKLETIKVNTPDPEVNVLANGWLLYQAISSRLWGRSGYYQSSGAFGFRDQLQDVMCVVHHAPHMTRAQIIKACEHQFEEGDVLHWWHQHPTGGLDRGVRTHFSDDLLWLPLVVSYYINITGDDALLTDVSTHFLTGPPVDPDKESNYFQPERSKEVGTVYEHCKRAILNSLRRTGERGLPLIGCGDWNDGFSEIGKDGKGESVWMAMFLFYVLGQFAEMSRIVKDDEFIELCKSNRQRLQESIEKHTWDGEWYRRAYFDDGTPLGSSSNDECQIDSLAQSWSIISGACENDRALTALESAYRRLVRKDLSLIQLFDPPFDEGPLRPGYIKGYAPGVRENGGQYTHAALWLIWAFTMCKTPDHQRRAWEMFDLINPINHARNAQELQTYRVEPYVVSADVYVLKGHEGQGGWSWYTGASGWMYRLIINQLLGINRQRNHLYFTPVPRPSWKEYSVQYRFGQSIYDIKFTKRDDINDMVVTVDDRIMEDKKVPLRDRHRRFRVQVLIPSL